MLVTSSRERLYRAPYAPALLHNAFRVQPGAINLAVLLSPLRKHLILLLLRELQVLLAEEPEPRSL